MKIYKGKEKIGDYKNVVLTIDFDDLFKFRGERKARVEIEKRLGRLLLITGFLIFSVCILLLVLGSNFTISEFLAPTKALTLISYFGIPFILYGLFLRREFDEFDYNFENKHLYRILNYKDLPKEIEIDNFFTSKVLDLFDYLYFLDSERFFARVADEILKNQLNKEIISKRLGIDPENLRAEVFNFYKISNTSFENNYKDFFIFFFSEGLNLETDLINEQVVLFAYLKYHWKTIMQKMEVSELEVEGLRLWFRNEIRKQNYFRKWKELSKLKPKGAMNRSYTSRATHVLDEFGEDYSANSAKGRFETSIGRDEEISQMLRILQKDNNAAVMLLGEPGVGKSRFLRYLATKMVLEDVPKILQDKRLVVIDLNKVFTKTSSLDSFKTALQKMLEEIVESGNIIVVFEDFTQVLNIRSDGKLEVINLIINMINNYKLKVIATATYSQYVQHVKPLKALASLFETIEIKEPAKNLALQILLDEVPRIEKQNGVVITLDSIKRIVEFAPRFDHERVLPDKGIALLEEAIVSAKSHELQFIDANLIDKILTEKVGVNVGDISKEESEKLASLEQEMMKKVVGQDQAIRAIASALRRSRAGINNAKRPVASFLFYGPTGVGKTEVAKTLAAKYYGDEKMMIRLDMSEYHEFDNLGRLIGYTDNFGGLVGGVLTEAVRSRPFSLILLDEIEKANPKVLDIFLQVLDDGHLTDGIGRKIDFTNTIIIATSNAGSKEIARLMSEGESYEDVRKETLSILRDVFRVEFLNRFDKIIMFNPMNKFAQVEQIAEIMLNDIKKNLNDKGMDISWNSFTLSRLAEKGYNPIYGARELKRVIQDTIEDKIAELIIRKELTGGKHVVFDGLDVIEIR